jgi:LPXTG-motif cell wall-anchored protein
MLRRTVVSLIALSAVLLISAGTSHAQGVDDNYTGACSIAVSPTNPKAGDTVTVTGTNFPTSPSSLPISIGTGTGKQQIGTATVNSGGGFSASATIPAGVSGTQTISVPCATSGGDATTLINVQAVTATAPPAGPPLARTGSDTQPLLLAGLGAVAVGTALVLTARRRRAHRAAA